MEVTGDIHIDIKRARKVNTLKQNLPYLTGIASKITPMVFHMQTKHANGFRYKLGPFTKMLSSLVREQLAIIF